VILSTILLRLWIALTTSPGGFQMLLTWVLMTGYWAIAAPLSLRWGFSSLEPVQVWLNLQLHTYGLALRKNRQALFLMIGCAFWIGLEEICLRVALLPLRQEQLSLWWLVLGWAIAMVRYPLGYGLLLHNFFFRPRLLFLAGLLELICIVIYFASQSFWLTTLIHWSVVAIWLFPLGGRYQMWSTQKIKFKHKK
jgi:predicted Abi (CAAX) family protease